MIKNVCLLISTIVFTNASYAHPGHGEDAWGHHLYPLLGYSALAAILFFLGYQLVKKKDKLHQLLAKLDSAFKFPVAQAHCDIPCKIYDPITAQVATLSVIRFLDLINDLEKKPTLSISDQATLSRLVREKEIHAKKVKDEIGIIWGDYFKQPQFEQYPDVHALVHSIMLAASACKQHIDRANGEKLLTLVNEFATAFWGSKGVDTYTATCPYPPAENVVYPVLNK